MSVAETTKHTTQLKIQWQNGSCSSQLQWRTEQTVSQMFKTLIRNHKVVQKYRKFNECCTIPTALVFSAKFSQFDLGDVNQHKVSFDNRKQNKVGYFIKLVIQSHGISLRLIFTSNGVGVGVVIRSVELNYDLVKTTFCL